MAETLADRVKRLQAEMATRASAQKQRAYQSSSAKAARDVASASWFFATLGMGLHWAWLYFVWPIWRQLRRPLWWLAGRYVALWNWFVIVRDPYGKPTFSKTRAGVMVIATALFWWFLVDPLVGLACDGAIYAATAQHNEEIVLFGSQEVDSKNNVHIAEGCYNYPCHDGASLYFRIKNSLFNNVWKMTHTGGFFYPDLVAAAIPTGYSRCVVTSYGLRWRVFVMNTEIFPELLDVSSCEAIAPAAK
jgi:hypothetical protein